VLLERIEPNLGMGRATVLDEYPTCEAAWRARPRAIPRVASASSSTSAGVEIANAFGELTDPASSVAASKPRWRKKQRVHGERYPVDEISERARRPCRRVRHRARFDRLAMLATGAQRNRGVACGRRLAQ